MKWKAVRSSLDLILLGNILAVITDEACIYFGNHNAIIATLATIDNQSMIMVLQFIYFKTFFMIIFPQIYSQ